MPLKPGRSMNSKKHARLREHQARRAFVRDCWSGPDIVLPGSWIPILTDAQRETLRIISDLNLPRLSFAAYVTDSARASND